MRAVIDTNVLLFANGDHADVSTGCRTECIRRLMDMQENGVVVIDDGYRILSEYGNKTNVRPPKGVGDVFLKWLLRQTGNRERVEQVAVTDAPGDCLVEFPDPSLQPSFDAPDRKFAAVAHAHPHKPVIWQAADCKWLDWWQPLHKCGVAVEFLCGADACRFYATKFPKRPVPALPARSAL